MARGERIMDTRFFLYFVVPLSLGVVITLVGAILLFIDSRKKPKDGEVDIENWLTTGGKVTSAKLSEQPADDTYEPIVNYVYTVNDTEYHGSKVFPGKNPSSKKDTAQEILDKHPVNMYVPVRYNPENPSDSALEAQPLPMNYIALAGWILSGFGVSSCCFTAFMTFVIFGAAQ
jgi:hypothetical protein